MTIETTRSTLKKKIVVIDTREGKIQVFDPDTLQKLIASLEAQDHKYFIVEL